MTQEQKEMIENLSQNHTALQIEGIMNHEVTASAVHGYLKKINIEPLTNAELYKNKLYKEAHLYTREEMIKRLGVGINAFDKYVEETGVVFKNEGAKEEYITPLSYLERVRVAGIREGVAEYIRDQNRSSHKD